MNAEAAELRLQALLDGELGAAEAAAVLAEVESDPALRELLCALTVNRALVRQAYAGLVPPPAAPLPTPRRRGLVLAGLGLLALTLVGGWQVSQRRAMPSEALAVAPAGEAGHIVLHVSAVGAGQARAALERVEGLYLAARDTGQPLTVEIVANGSGLDLLRMAASTQAARLESLRQAHPTLTLVACGQTVQRLREQGGDVRLVPGTVVARSALDQIVQRLQQGWAYVRL